MTGTRRTALGLLAFAVFMACWPQLPVPVFWITLANYIGLYALVALGLVLLTGVGGMTSFGQAAFVGIGAYATAWLSTAYGVSPWLGLLAGLASTGVVSLALGLITMRLSGHYLPLGTIAWGLALFYLFGNLDVLGRFDGINGIAPISLGSYALQSGHQMYYLIWLVVVAALLACFNLLASRPGRALRALRTGAQMAESMGVDTLALRIQCFVLAALLASVSGWLYAHLQRAVNPTPFGINAGIEYLFMAVVGGAGHLWGAVAGAAVFTLLKDQLQGWLPRLLGADGNYEIIVLGALLVLLLQRTREGLWPQVQRFGQAVARRGMAQRARAADARGTPGLREPLPQPVPQGPQSFPADPAGVSSGAAERPEGRPAQAPDATATGELLLRVREAGKRFGGLQAVGGMSFELHAGEIVGLIGPNGAGKSTMFNLVSGVLPLSEGRVEWRGRSLTGEGARQVAALGMGRTFQHVKLVADMSVIENVALGAHLRSGAGMLRSMLRLNRAEEQRVFAEARRQLARVGLADVARHAAGSLPLGQQRILEIARALCAGPRLLLLDEPAAGLRHREKEALARLLRQLRDEGMGVLIVEHDMDFVMQLTDRLIVMEFGRKIAEGDPAAIQRDPAVRRAYLGDEPDDDALNGSDGAVRSDVPASVPPRPVSAPDSVFTDSRVA
mgnify:FL=1